MSAFAEEISAFLAFCVSVRHWDWLYSSLIPCPYCNIWCLQFVPPVSLNDTPTPMQWCRALQWLSADILKLVEEKQGNTVVHIQHVVCCPKTYTSSWCTVCYYQQIQGQPPQFEFIKAFFTRDIHNKKTAGIGLQKQKALNCRYIHTLSFFTIVCKVSEIFENSHQCFPQSKEAWLGCFVCLLHIIQLSLWHHKHKLQ